MFKTTDFFLVFGHITQNLIIHAITQGPKFCATVNPQRQIPRIINYLKRPSN